MKKSQKYLIALGIALFVYTIVGFFVVPAVVKYFAVKTLQEQVSPDATIETVRANPFTFQLQVEQLNLPDPAGVWSVGFERATVNASAMTFLKFYPVMDFIRLESPQINYLRKPSSESSSEDEATAEDEAPQTLEELAVQLNGMEIPKVRIDLLEVINGNVDFRDETNPVQFTESINPLNFVLEDFTTVVDASGDNTMRFLAKTDTGTELEWSGALESHPLSTTGTVRISEVQIDEFSPYFAQFLQFTLKQAVYDMQFDYRVDFGDLDALLQISNGAVALTDVLCHPTEDETAFFSLDSVAISGFSAAYPSMEVEVDSIAVKEGFTRLVRDGDGAINLLNLVTLPVTDEATEAEPAEAEAAVVETQTLPAPKVRIHSITVDQYRMRLEDAFISQPAELEVLLASLTVQNVSTDLTETVQVAMTLHLGESGRVNLEGTVVPGSGQVDLTIGLQSLPLDLGNAYAESLAQARVESGTFTFDGALSGDLESGYHLTGDGSLPDLAAHLSGPNTVDASWQSMEFAGLAVSSLPLSVTLESLQIVEPSAELTHVSVPEVIESDESNPAEGATQKGVAEPLNLEVRVGTVQVEAGSVFVVDQVIQPSVRLSVENIQTEVSNITLGQDEATDFTVTAEVNRSPFKMEGRLFPVDPRAKTQMSLQLDALALPVFSPYSGQAVGRGLGSGWFTLKSEVTVDAGDLDARNQIIIDQLELGDRVESPDALRLPLGLAISLLKGPNGVMDLSLPLSGDLYDPSVGLGQIIRTAVVGLITNVASAPFKLLSGLVGSEEDLSQVAFAPGSAGISPEATRQLTTLAEALNRRPELNVTTLPSLSEDDLILLASRNLRDELLSDTEDTDDRTFEKRLRRAYQAYADTHAPLPYDLAEDASEAVKVAHMKAVLLTEVSPSSESAQALLQARSEAVRKALVEENGVAAERVLSGEPDLAKDRAMVRFELE